MMTNSFEFEDNSPEMPDDVKQNSRMSVRVGSLKSATRACMTDVTREMERQFKLSVNTYAIMLTQSVTEEIKES